MNECDPMESLIQIIWGASTLKDGQEQVTQPHIWKLACLKTLEPLPTSRDPKRCIGGHRRSDKNEFYPATQHRDEEPRLTCRSRTRGSKPMLHVPLPGTSRLPIAAVKMAAKRFALEGGHERVAARHRQRLQTQAHRTLLPNPLRGLRHVPSRPRSGHIRA